MNLSLIDLIFRKELLEAFRDKKTLIFMILMPILLYPLLGIGFFQIALIQASKVREDTSRIAFRGGEPPPRLIELLEEQGHFETLESEFTEDDLQMGRLEAIIEFPADYRTILAEGKQIQFKILYDDASERSSAAHARILNALAAYRQEIILQRLADRGLTEEFLNPVSGESQRAASPERRAGYHLGRLLPYLILLMIINGTMYPAIDITAGEKERGTLECLLASPPTPMEIVLAKFSIVFFFGVISTVLNLVSLGLTATSVFQSIRAQGIQEMFALSISWDTMAMTAVSLVPFTILFSALLVTIASFADSFKEAQTYIMPLFLIVVLPALVSALPGTELRGLWLVIPIANLCLLMKALFLQQASLNQIAMVFVSSCAYAGAALSLAVRLFSQEEVIFPREHSFAVLRGRLFSRRPQPPGALEPRIGVSDALMAYAIVFPLSYFIGALAPRTSPLLGLSIQQWGAILGVPLAIAWLARLDLRQTFLVRPARPLALLGMFLALLGGMGLIRLYAVFQEQWLPTPDLLGKDFSRLIADASHGSLLLLLFLGAFSPAICEEMFFRGFILSGLRSRLSKWQSLIISALLFGAMHMLIYQFVPTALLGLLLAWIAWETGSLLPGIVFHFLNNAVALTWLHFSNYGGEARGSIGEEAMKKIGGLLEGGQYWPVAFVATGIMILGCWVVRRSVRETATNA